MVWSEAISNCSPGDAHPRGRGTRAGRDYTRMKPSPRFGLQRRGRRRLRRRSSWIAIGPMVLFLAACGSSLPTVDIPTPTPTPCTQTKLAEGDGPIAAKTLAGHSFSTLAIGRVDVTVNWTFPASPIGVYLVQQGSCTIDQFNGRTCGFLIRSEAPGPKPRIVSASNVAPGNYQVVAANYAARNESLSLQVILSSSECPSVATSSLGRPLRDRIDWEPMGTPYR